MPRPTLKLAPTLEESLSLSEGFALEGLEALEAIEEALLELERRPTDPDLLKRLLRPLHTLRSNAAILELSEIYRLTQRMESLTDWLHRSRMPADGSITALLLEAVDRLRHHCQTLLRDRGGVERPADRGGADRPSIPLGPGGEPPAGNDTDAVLECRLEGAFNRLRNGAPSEPPLGDILVEQGAIRREDLESALALRNQPTGALLVALGLTTPEHVAAALARQRRQGPLHLSLRLEARRLERLTELSASLLGACSNLGTNSSPAELPGGQVASFCELRRIARLLWGEVAGLRQTPLTHLFQRLKRAARDLSSHLGRDLEVSCSGESLELEVEYVEALTGVLVHAVRNAIYHGLEEPDERRNAGKPARGRLIWTASREGDEATLVLADDGRGLDPLAISRRARQLGFVDTTALPGSARWDVLFEPGFSITDAPGDEAGHGLGLNIIRETVIRIGGRVWLESQTGLGTGLIIQLPTRAGYLEGIVVLASGVRFVLPAGSVIEYARPSFAQCRDLNGPHPSLTLRGSPVPLVWLALRAGRYPSQRPLWESLVVVLEVRQRLLGLVVDDLIGPQRVPACSAPPGPVPGLPGRVVLEDGEVAELVVPEALFGS